jgi:Erv1 / Alr family
MKRYTRKNKIRRNKTIKKRVFTDEDFKSNNGFNTAIWGSCMWLFLHTISFNYPVKPTEDVKKNYKSFILNLQNILPCKICRENLKNNFKTLPLKDTDLENRDSFSRYIYSLHELINTMLEKKSGLTYEMVRERFEHFRGISKNTLKNKEKGCTGSLYGVKSKCILKIVPHNTKEDTIQINKKCLKKR